MVLLTVFQIVFHNPELYRLNIQGRKVCPEEFACPSFVVQRMGHIHSGSHFTSYYKFPNLIFKLCSTNGYF